MILDTSTTIDRYAKFQYTFIRPKRGLLPDYRTVEMQTKRITVYAKAWHNHEAQARARLPWGWVRSMVSDFKVLRV